MSKLILMCGIPGAGKSTHARLLEAGVDANYIWVSRDHIRFSMVSEDEEYFSKEKAVFKEFCAQINEGLYRGYDVFADATHINPVSRRKLLLNLDLSFADEIEVVWINTSLETCLARNEQRKGTRAYVPQDVIRNMGIKFTAPEYNEISRGYDKIWIVEEDGTMFLKEKEE